MGLLGQKHAHIISSHKSGRIGQNKDAGPRVDPDPEIYRLYIQAVVDYRRKGNGPDTFRVQLQQDMVHGGIATDRHILDIFTIQVPLARLPTRLTGRIAVDAHQTQGCGF